MKDIDATLLESILSQLSMKALNLGGRILVALFILFVGSKLVKFALKIFDKTMERTEADTSVSQFLHSFFKAALYVILTFIMASYCGVDAASIVALLGSAGVAIGLALQGSLSNLAGGILILLLRPFSVGDYIVDSSGNEGVVDEIQIFYTRLRTGDNKLIILPNGNLANNSITNVTTAKVRRCDITIGISYNADIKLAKEVLQKVLDEDPGTMKDRDRLVYVSALGDSSVNIGVRCWFENDEYFPGMWRLNENIKYALDAAGVEIPYPQMDVHVKKETDL